MLLGTGIVAGGVASHAVVSVSRNLAIQQGLAFVEALQTGRPPFPKPTVEAGPYRACRRIMVFALIGAVICLTGYGMTTLLGDAKIPAAP